MIERVYIVTTADGDPIAAFPNMGDAIKLFAALRRGEEILDSWNYIIEVPVFLSWDTIEEMVGQDADG